MTDVIPFSELGLDDLEQVGGKNTSLGEMISSLASSGVRVPGGFATTADAYRGFLRDAGIDARIGAILEGLDSDDVVALAAAGAQIRDLIRKAPFPVRPKQLDCMDGRSWSRGNALEVKAWRPSAPTACHPG